MKKASEKLSFSEETKAVLAGSRSAALSCSGWALFSYLRERFVQNDVQVVTKLKETKLWFGSATTDVMKKEV